MQINSSFKKLVILRLPNFKRQWKLQFRIVLWAFVLVAPELTTTFLIKYVLEEGIFHETENLFSTIPWMLDPSGMTRLHIWKPKYWVGQKVLSGVFHQLF